IARPLKADSRQTRIAISRKRDVRIGIAISIFKKQPFDHALKRTPPRGVPMWQLPLVQDLFLRKNRDLARLNTSRKGLSSLAECSHAALSDVASPRRKRALLRSRRLWNVT